MNATEFLKAGELVQAIERARQDLRSRPLDAHGRMLLFELLGFAGQWDRAKSQLDALAELTGDPAARDLGLCRELLGAEVERERFLTTGSAPRFFIDPPAIATATLEAWGRLRNGDPAGAVERLEQAETGRLPQRGRLGQESFGEFRDSDDALAPVLEVFARGTYYWAPWEDIQYLDVPPPRCVRDLLWAPAKIALAQGILGKVYLPVLYPGSAGQADDLVRLGRKTSWVDAGCGLTRGAGLKTFLVDDALRTIFELQDLHFDAPAGPASSDAASARPA
jgi:type VI secretion system protein ImpE